MLRRTLFALAASFLFPAFGQVSVDTSKTSGQGLTTYTWAGKPAASAVPSGTVVRISDVGATPGMRFVSTGAVWRPDGPQVLCTSAVAVSVTGTVSETTLATCTIPAGAMGTNGGIEVRSAWSFTGSANNKTLRIRLGGVSGTQYLTTVQTTNVSAGDIRRVRARNSAALQVGGFASSVGGVGGAGAAVVTSSLDTTAAQDVVATCQLANTGETCTLEGNEVWLLP